MIGVQINKRMSIVIQIFLAKKKKKVGVPQYYTNVKNFQYL